MAAYSVYDFPSKFNDYVEGLNCSRSETDSLWCESHGLVFWSHQIEPSLSHDNHVDFIPDVCVSPKVTDIIRVALQKLICHHHLQESLVQFWAPTITLEGQTLLTTQSQPFAFGESCGLFDRKQLCEYRMSSVGCNFYADEESGEEQLGLPGRAFRDKYPIFALDVNCHIKGSLALPVIEHSGQTCVGVLEIVSLCSVDLVWLDRSFLNLMSGILKDRGVTLQLGPLDQQSIDGINNRMNGSSVAQNSVLPSPEPLQNVEVTTQVDSSDQPPMDPSNNGQNVVTAEGNITVVNSSKEGTRKRRAREHKQTGVPIEISLKDIHRYSKMSRGIAAKKLNVSISTLRRACRRNGITRWPPRNIENVYPFPPSPVENQGQTAQLSTNLPSNQASASVAHKKLAFQDADMVTIRAQYEDDMIKFRMSLSSTLVELQQEVAKRLKLEAGTYSVKYKDEEEQLISITCDEDLQDCIWTSKRLGKPSIVVQLKPKQPITHS